MVSIDDCSKLHGITDSVRIHVRSTSESAFVYRRMIQGDVPSDIEALLEVSGPLSLEVLCSDILIASIVRIQICV